MNAEAPQKTHKSVSSFLEGYAKKRSREIYLQGVSKFFEWKYKEKCTVNKKISTERIDTLAKRYFTEKNDYATDLTHYVAYLNNNYAPQSRRVYLSTAKQYLIFNEIEFKLFQERQIANKLPKGYNPRTREENLTIERIKQICENSPLQLRALILVLLSSGMRLGEALAIEEDDINFKADPVEVTLLDTYTKTGAGRTVFISREAADAVKSWLKIRGDYIELKKRVTSRVIQTKTPADNGKIFPMNRNGAIRKFNDALLKIGYCKKDDDGNNITDDKGKKLAIKDKQTKRSPIHLHQTRKYFRTVMAGGDSKQFNSLDCTEALLGHAGYLSQSYVRLTHQDLAEFYKENEHRLLIRQAVIVQSADAKALEEENTKLQDRIKLLELQMEALQTIEQNKNHFGIKLDSDVVQMLTALSNPDAKAKMQQMIKQVAE